MNRAENVEGQGIEAPRQDGVESLRDVQKGCVG